MVEMSIVLGFRGRGVKEFVGCVKKFVLRC